MGKLTVNTDLLLSFLLDQADDTGPLRTFLPDQTDDAGPLLSFLPDQTDDAGPHPHVTPTRFLGDGRDTVTAARARDHGWIGPQRL